MASMPMSDAIEAGCKLVGPPQRAWWFDRDGRMLLTDDVTMVATGACVLATAVVGRAGSLARAQQLVLVEWTLKLRETLGKAWPFLNEKVPVSEQACPTKGVCFPRPTEAWDWWHELQHMCDRHKVSREDIALRLRAAGK